ncbi:MAG: hypothetical protein H6Q25_1497 [Bacteroidetes bacterium]|nr:hypothetical protein [Bacteroidota bacterium]
MMLNVNIRIIPKRKYFIFIFAYYWIMMIFKLLKTTLFTVLVWASTCLYAQDSTLLVCNYPDFDASISFFDVDQSENIYIVDQSSTLTKMDIQGNLKGSFNYALYGTLTSISVLNPMKIMLFYKESGILLFLNDDLVPITKPFELLDKNYQNITCAVFTGSDQIVLYEPYESKIVILDFNGNEISKNQLSFEQFSPFTLIPNSSKGFVFQDSINGLFFFNSFGSFEKQLFILTPSTIQISGDVVAYFENGNWNEYNMKMLSQNQLEMQKLIPNTVNIQKIIKTKNHFIGINVTGKLFICEKNF